MWSGVEGSRVLAALLPLRGRPQSSWGGGPLRLPPNQPDCAAPRQVPLGAVNKMKNNVLEPRVKLNYLRKTL